MQVSALSIIEPLKRKLLEFPSLVNSLQNKDYDFLTLLDRWMKETETILKNNNIAQCSEIAGLRSKILTPIFTDSKKRSTRKMQLQIASEVLYDLQSTILSIIRPYEIKVNEARDLLIHLLSILKQSGAIKYGEGSNFQGFINQIWNLFSTHEQLKSSTVQILTLISQVDALRIISEEINLEEWMTQTPT